MSRSSRRQHARRHLRARWSAYAAGVGLVLAGLTVTVASPATAAVDCTPRSTTKAFAQFGDTNDYFPVTNGRFEVGSLGLNDELSGWSQATTATIVAENEPWRILGAADQRALSLRQGAWMLSYRFCVQVGEDSARLFVKSPGVKGARLHVEATVIDSDESDSANEAVNTLTIDGSQPGWMPTPRLPLPNVYDARGLQYVTLEITAERGDWLVDDILVDPWRTR